MVGTADAKVASHMYLYNPNQYRAIVVTVLWGAGCARQDQKSLFEREILRF